MIPIGGICWWADSLGSLPAGFVICDGTRGTRDLVNRSVFGAGGSTPVGEIGGFEEIPFSHTHGPGTIATFGGVAAGSHQHTYDVATGSGGAFATGNQEIGITTPMCPPGDHVHAGTITPTIFAEWLSNNNVHLHDVIGQALAAGDPGRNITRRDGVYVIQRIA